MRETRPGGYEGRKVERMKMERYSIMKFTSKQVMAAGYCGGRGGTLSGTHYAIYEDGKGFCSLDGGRTVYMLTGKRGRKSLQDIIDHGGFIGEISYRTSL